MASRAHPLLGVRLFVHAADRDPDVLPRRPAVRARPDLQLDPPPGRPGSAHRRLRPQPDSARVLDRVPLRHRGRRTGCHVVGARRRPRMTPEKTLPPTPGQTVGPFFAFGLSYPDMHEVVHPHSPGAIVLEGTVYDGAGQPIPDAVIEVWGADSDGAISRSRGSLRRDGHTFTGFGRSDTDDDGHYEFWTRNPGSI